MEEEQAHQLSEEERNALLAATKRQKQVAQKNSPELTHQKQEVSPEEYIRRLEAARKKDINSLSHLRDTKIHKAVQEWRDKVGPVFADAHVDYPQIVERVNRQRTKQGLHKTSILFYGDKYGRGKTWAAFSYINSLIQEGIILPGQVFNGTESSTLSRIANSGFDRSDEMMEMKRDRHRVFFIDDVGQGYFFKKEHREEVWYELIDHVYTRRLTLILTTNLNFTVPDNGRFAANDLGAHIGGRAFDRLRTLIGDDGAMLLRGINRRDQIFMENETKYRSSKK